MGADMLSLNKWRGNNNVLSFMMDPKSFLPRIPGNALTSSACVWGESSALCSLSGIRREMFCLSISNRVIFAISGLLFHFFPSAA